MSKSIRIYYGPYECFNTLSYKPQKLKGLQDRLLKLGYRVELRPVKFQDYCVIEMCGYEIFRCNIKHLQFNMPYELDAVCQRAIAAVQRASEKFQRARNYFGIRNLLENLVFSNDMLPKNYWSEKLVLKSFSTCSECLDCCGILVAKK